jgi:hypothetical protein
MYASNTALKYLSGHAGIKVTKIITQVMILRLLLVTVQHLCKKNLHIV